MKNDIVPNKNAISSASSRQPNAYVGHKPQSVEHPGEAHTLKLPSELPSLEEPLEAPQQPKKSRRKWAIFGVVFCIVVFLCGIVAFLFSPPDASATEKVPVEIVSGMVPSQIADALKQEGVIRSPLMFLVYTRLTGTQDTLQAGNYKFSPADSLKKVVSQLQAGPEVDEIEVTFKPGATLADNKKELLSLGYSAEDIDAAFKAEYDHPLFATKPAGVDLEGYLYGETHRFVKGTPLKTILTRYFDDYYEVVTKNNLVDSYKQQNLTLYQGITLASIVQRESGGDDKAGIAQVFLKRLSSDMQLGSDVTYQYIADKEGNPRDVNYDSPYNTRRYTGLPPGPIATPGVDALIAVGKPAAGDYLYFLSGDDNITYFARTLAEHEANIREHCQEKCTIL